MLRLPWAIDNKGFRNQPFTIFLSHPRKEGKTFHTWEHLVNMHDLASSLFLSSCLPFRANQLTSRCKGLRDRCLVFVALEFHGSLSYRLLWMGSSGRGCREASPFWEWTSWHSGWAEIFVFFLAHSFECSTKSYGYTRYWTRDTTPTRNSYSHGFVIFLGSMGYTAMKFTRIRNIHIP